MQCTLKPTCPDSVSIWKVSSVSRFIPGGGGGGGIPYKIDLDARRLH